MGIFTGPSFKRQPVFHTSGGVSRVVFVNVGDVRRALTQVRYGIHFTPTGTGEPAEQDYAVYYWGVPMVATVAGVTTTDLLDVNEIIPVRPLIDPATDLSGLDEFPDSNCTPGVKGGGCGWVQSQKEGTGVSGATLIFHVGGSVTPFVAVYKGTKAYFYAELDVCNLSDGMVVSNTLSGNGSPFTFPAGSPLTATFTDEGSGGTITLEFCVEITLDCSGGSGGSGGGPGEGPPPGTDGALDYLPVRRCSDDSYAGVYVAWSGYSGGEVFKVGSECYYIDITANTTATGTPALDTSDPKSSCAACGGSGPGEGPPPGSLGALNYVPVRKCSTGEFAPLYIEWLGHAPFEVYRHTDGQCYYLDLSANSTATNSPLIDESSPHISCTACNCIDSPSFPCCFSRDTTMDVDWEYNYVDNNDSSNNFYVHITATGLAVNGSGERFIGTFTETRTDSSGTTTETYTGYVRLAPGDNTTWIIHHDGFDTALSYVPESPTCCGFDEADTRHTEDPGEGIDTDEAWHYVTTVANNHCCKDGDCVQGTPACDGTCGEAP